ncbi:MAG TPA: hypothetical protein VF192_10675 [Longimicrobiales bacterium]
MSAIERTRAATQHAHEVTVGHALGGVWRGSRGPAQWEDDRADDPEAPVRVVRPVPYVDVLFSGPPTVLETEPPTLPELGDQDAQTSARRPEQPRGPVARQPNDDTPGEPGRDRPPTARRPEQPPTREPPAREPPEDEPSADGPSEIQPPVRQPSNIDASRLWLSYLRARRTLSLLRSRRCNDLGWDLDGLRGFYWQPRSPLYDPIWDDSFALAGCGDPFDGIAMLVMPDYAVEASCAVVTIEEFGAEPRSFNIPLPALSAKNAKALRAAIQQRFDRGMPVFLWDEDGNEIRLDPATIDNFSVERCDR